MKTRLLLSISLLFLFVEFGWGQTYNYITQWGGSGSGNGQFYSPYGAAVDGSGNVYVTDAGNKRVQKFSSNGTFITQWAITGSISGPTGIAVDVQGNVYV